MFPSIEKEDRQFLFSWAILTGAGSVAGLLLMSILFGQIIVRIIGENEDLETMTAPLVALSVVLNALPGLTIGLGQWFELRNLLPEAWKWILATVAGWLVGFGLSSILYLLIPDLPFLLLFVIRFIGIGLFAGLIQWWYLKGHISDAVLWIPVSILASLIGGFSWLIAGEIGGAIGWIIAGGISGYALLKLRDRDLIS
jgi:hypothetical protein